MIQKNFIISYFYKTKRIYLSLSVLNWSSVWIIFLMSLNSVVDLLNVYLISKLVGSKNILGKIDLNIITLDNNSFLLLLFSVILFKLFLGYFYNKTLYSFSTSLEDDLRMDLFDCLSKMSYVELIKYSAADLSHTIAELTKNYANGYVVPFFRLFNELLLVFLMTLYLIYVNSQIFFVFLIVVVAIAFVSKVFFGKDRESFGEKNIRLTMNIVNIVNVFKSGYKEIRVNRKFEYFKLRLTNLSSLLKSNQLKYLMKSIMPKIYLEFLSIFLIILCIYLFQYFNIDNPLFVLASIVLVLLRLGPSVSSVNSLIIQLKYNYSSWARISLFKKKYVFNKVGLFDSDSVDNVQTLSISNISFSYNNKIIFNNAKVVFKKGRCYVLIGQSGIGKSTFLDIVSGIHNSEVRFETNEISKKILIIIFLICLRSRLFLMVLFWKILFLKRTFRVNLKRNVLLIYYHF